MFFEALLIFSIAMWPIIELRGAIPLAILAYDFSPWTAYLLVVIGNIIPAIILIPLLGKIDTLLSKKSDWWRRVFVHHLEKIRDSHSKKFEVLKEFALVFLVAIPLPFTGVWAASLAAYIFGISFRKAVPLIFLGILIAGAIVLAATLGLSTLFTSI